MSAKRALLWAILVLSVGLCGIAYAQDAKPAGAAPAAPALAPAAATPVPATTPAAAPAVEAPADATATPTAPAPDLTQQLADAKAAYEQVKANSTTPKKFLYAALIAAIANILLTMVKKTAKLTTRGKKYLPWAALGLGLIVGAASYYTAGTTLIDALIYGGGGPGAIILQELLGFLRKTAPQA